MKALIVTNLEKRFLPGHHSMIDPLKELGFEVTWASNFSEYKEDLTQAPCKTVHIDFIRNPFNPLNVKAYRQLLNLLKNERYDVVHCNTPIGGVLGRLCGIRALVPVIIYTAHGFHFYQGAPLVNQTIYMWAELFLARFTDVLITINQEDYQAVQKFKLRNNGIVYHVPGVGVDTSRIKSCVAKRDELLKEINAANSAILLIAVGELNLNKNNHVIINALGKLADPNIHFILCGAGEQRNQLISLAKKNNIEKNVHFLGFRTDGVELIKSCDIFVTASYREGLSRALMEAMGAGLPCVVSRIRGNTDLIVPSKGGYHSDPDDVDGFAKTIKELATDPVLRKRMGLYNLETVTQFDVENVKVKMKEIYERVM